MRPLPSGNALWRKKTFNLAAADALEDVFNAVVELGKKGGSSGFLTDCWLSTSHVPPQCQQFVYRRLQRFEIDGDFLTKFSGFHSSTLPRRSMRRVKRVGGSRGMRSSGMRNSSSSRAPNS